jgi:hypothetical protein
VVADRPSAGQVYDYPYVWHWQHERGETEGRKPRPACVAVVTGTTGGQHMVFMAAITKRAPEAGRATVAIPETEAHRGGLDADLPLWVVVDELNADVWEASFVFEDRIPRGRFSPGFTDRIVREIQAIRQRGKLKLAPRR